MPPPPAPPSPADVPQQLAELTGLMRELVTAMREQNAAAKETLVLARKAEQRFEEQRQAQRDDFQRWLQEHGLVKRRTKPAEETARAVLGRAIASVVDYCEQRVRTLTQWTDYGRVESMNEF